MPVLVVDDQPDVREIIVEFLSERFTVYEASNGVAALAILAEHPISVLVTDVIMPGMNGIELAEAAIVLRPNIKIVLISGFVARLDVDRPKWRFLTKPFRMTKLIAAIDVAKEKAGNPARSPA